MAAGSDFIETLDAIVNEEWDIIHRGRFMQHVLSTGFDRDLYKMTMLQIYHYTRHNAINQAFASWKVEPERIGMLRYAFEHAGEELGHERMVIKDLESVGLLEPGDLKTQPLPATEAFIGYLYYVGLHYGAVPRLGYSYWAETAYDHIDKMLDRMRSDLNLTDRNMSFFVAHSVIDQKHAKEVREAIEKNVREGVEQEQVMQVTRTTLRQTGTILNQVLDAYLARSN